MLKIKDPIILQSENTDCEGSWGDWSTCTNDSQNRTYTVTKEPSETGQPCPSPLTETRFCIDTTETEIGKWPYRIQQNTTWVKPFDAIVENATTKTFSTTTNGDGQGATIELHFGNSIHDEKQIIHYQFKEPGSGYKLGDEISVTTGIFGGEEFGVAPPQDFIIKLEKITHEEEEEENEFGEWWHWVLLVISIPIIIFVCMLLKDSKKKFLKEEIFQDVGSVLTSISVL